MSGSPTREGVACAAASRVHFARGGHLAFFANHPGTFTILALRPDGRQMLHGGAAWDIRFVGPSKGAIAEVIDHDDGTYTVRYMVPMSGRYQLHVRLNEVLRNMGSKSKAIAGSPFTVNVGREDQAMFLSERKLGPEEERAALLRKGFDRIGNASALVARDRALRAAAFRFAAQVPIGKLHLGVLLRMWSARVQAWHERRAARHAEQQRLLLHAVGYLRANAAARCLRSWQIAGNEARLQQQVVSLLVHYKAGRAFHKMAHSAGAAREVMGRIALVVATFVGWRTARALRSWILNRVWALACRRRGRRARRRPRPT